MPQREIGVETIRNPIAPSKTSTSESNLLFLPRKKLRVKKSRWHELDTEIIYNYYLGCHCQSGRAMRLWILPLSLTNNSHLQNLILQIFEPDLKDSPYFYIIPSIPPVLVNTNPRLKRRMSQKLDTFSASRDLYVPFSYFSSHQIHLWHQSQVLLFRHNILFLHTMIILSVNRIWP